MLLSSEASGKLLDLSSWGGWGKVRSPCLSLETEAQFPGCTKWRGGSRKKPILVSCPTGLGALLHCGSSQFLKFLAHQPAQPEAVSSDTMTPLGEISALVMFSQEPDTSQLTHKVLNRYSLP